jgi:bacterioferritin (cytochrome b1)
MNLQEIFQNIIKDDNIHARFLNTLSLMENTGARKISASEHKTKVSYLILKHACEEARHAFYLKKQISKIAKLGDFPTYENAYLVAPFASYTYLHSLDIQVCRYLKQALNLSGEGLKYAAYLLVTYAIEVRADELYPIYQNALDEVKSKVNVKSIIVEEEGHLTEMIEQLKSFSPNWEIHANKACEIEKGLFDEWALALGGEVGERRCNG